MANLNLDSLVLRGVAVLVDGTAVNLRLGTGCAAVERTPGNLLSMRHPSLGWPQGYCKPDGQRPNHVAQNRMVQAANGAGRSRSRAGVLRSSTRIGGPKAMAATRLRRFTTRPTAAVGEALALSWRGIDG
jgi:hypothetical protein